MDLLTFIINTACDIITKAIKLGEITYFAFGH